MRHITMKSSIIWMNIGEIAVSDSKIAFSVYKSAHFYGNGSFFSSAHIVLR